MIETPLEERGKTHGDYVKLSRVAQATKRVWRTSTNWDRLRPTQKEALELVATKVARMLEGDPNFKDHIVDIIGYLELSGK